MSLKNSIVIVNEYTVKQKGKGSRGKTPGAYVLRYMAREDAVETLTPVRQYSEEDYIMRYMAREEAVDTAESLPELKRKFKKHDKKAGISFSEDDNSLSSEDLRKKSREIQEAFDSGKTIMKTVLSFREEYLKEMGIIPEDFEFRKAGDYKGNLDGMKLRMGIRKGLEKMGNKYYDDLKYVGVIQVDTENVHCHLAMYDNGEGKLTPDGTQKGKISSPMKDDLRRGMDMFLDEKKTIQKMAGNVTYDKRNALCYLKKYTHKAMDEKSFSQFLTYLLPEDKSLWRAGSNSKEMKRANNLTENYVKGVYQKDDSGYREAMRKIEDYAYKRREREGLSLPRYRRLIENGEKALIDDGVNAVYTILKRSDRESDKTVDTPFLNAMARDYDDLKDNLNDPLVEFSYKLRSYGSRLTHHKNEKRKWGDFKKRYEESEDISPDSLPLYEFFKNEEEYNKKCMAKYQHLLPFLPYREGEEEGKHDKELKDVLSYMEKYRNINNMRRDESFKKIAEKETAEDYGLRTYEMHGGRFLKDAPHIIDERIEKMDTTLRRKLSLFKDNLSDDGYVFDEDEKALKRGISHEFDDVKAMDLHHLSLDFKNDFKVSPKNAVNFKTEAEKRYKTYTEAVKYLNATGQEKMIKSLPGSDINLMHEKAVSLTDTVKSEREDKAPVYKKKKTIPLDISYEKEFDTALKTILHSDYTGYGDSDMIDIKTPEKNTFDRSYGEKRNRYE